MLYSYFGRFINVTNLVDMNNNNLTPNWYVIYTYPRAERKVNNKIKELGIETFLPLHMVVRQWKDRKKKLELPLFPNYVFINSIANRRYNVFQVNGVVKFVSFEGKPAIIPEAKIKALKKILKGEVEISNNNFYEKGMKVKIRQGKFFGSEGVLIRRNGKTRLMVQIEALNTCVSVDISTNDVEPITDVIHN